MSFVFAFIAMFIASPVSHLTIHIHARIDTHTDIHNSYPFQFDDCYFYHDLVYVFLLAAFHLIPILRTSFTPPILHTKKAYIHTQNNLYQLIFFATIETCLSTYKTIHILLATQCDFSACIFLCDVTCIDWTYKVHRQFISLSIGV